MREGWVETTLDGIADYINGYPFKPADLGEVGLPVIRIKQLLDSNEPVDRTETDTPDRCLLRDGDIVFSWSGTLAVRIWNRGPAKLNQHLFRVVEKEGVYKGIIPLILDHAIEELEEKSHGTTMKHITKQTLLPHKVLLPPLSEQKRIVDLISSVDSYIEALEQQIGSVRSASDAHLEKIVSAFSDDWREVTLGEVLEISRGGSPRPIQEYLTDSEDGINWVKIADATRSEKYIYSTLQKIKREGISRSREVFAGDFVLSNSMSFGRPYIMCTDGCIHDGWLLLSKVSSNFDQDFLYNLLNSDYVQRQFESLAAGSGVRNLNIEVVKKVKVKIPTIHVQTELASVINEFDNFIIKLTKQLHSGFNLRNALLSDLLSGEHQIPESYDKVMGAA
jgi:type I restriction enzyme S subunit